MAEVYVGLGSNLGDRVAYLECVVASLARFGVLRRSSWYETIPVRTCGPPFLNGVVGLRTSARPLELLRHIQAVERDLGRGTADRAGPRTVDIDVLMYGQCVIRSPELVVPHPRMDERAFVLVPFDELAPEVVHPVSGLTIAQLLESVETSGVRLRAA